MGQVSAKLRAVAGGKLSYWCQGCDETHAVTVEGPGAWGFDGNLERPTFTPSVLIRSGHFMPEHKSGEPCWCTYNARRAKEGKPPVKVACQQCHTFITGGIVQFLGDCSHALAGQTLPLPDLPEHLRD
jgi:hypothetical protein